LTGELLIALVNHNFIPYFLEDDEDDLPFPEASGTISDSKAVAHKSGGMSIQIRLDNATSQEYDNLLLFSSRKHEQPPQAEPTKSFLRRAYDFLTWD
jgi:transcriptional regulator GlxA family with amidase domain